MRVKQRLRINSAVSALSVLVILIVLCLMIYRVNRALEASKYADAIIIASFERLMLRTDFYQTGSERSKTQLIAKHKQIGDLLKAASATFSAPEDLNTINELLAIHESIGKIARTINKSREKRSLHTHPDALSQEIEDRLFNQLNMRVYEALLSCSKLQASSKKAVITSLWQAGGGILAGFLIISASILINSWLMNRAITDRIRTLRDGALAIGEGNLDNRIDVTGDDEFVELSESLNAMTAKLRDTYHDLENEIEERKRAEELLRESRADLARAQEVGGIGSWRLDVKQNVLYWSDENHRIFGIPKGIPLSYESFLATIHPDDRTYVDRQWLAALGGQPYDIEHRILVDGRVKWVREKAFLELDGPDNLLGGFGITQDITQRKEVEEELRKAHDELELRVRKRTEELAESLENQRQEMIERERAEISLHQETLARLQAVEALREKDQMLIQQSRQAALGEMIGNIAHQWRQPLNALGLFTQRLGLFYDTPNFNKEFLDASVAKSMEIIQHMSKTIDDFRDYFKPDKEKVDFKVGSAIKNTLSLLEGSFQSPKINIVIDAQDDPVINGFQNEFAQVLLNILINARDAIIERGIAGAEVTITTFSEGGCAVVTIVDNAGGIPEAVIGKVFDPYFTTKGPQKGTGVGLFMSKTIIEKNMGGKLTVRNTDRGAEFRIEV